MSADQKGSKKRYYETHRQAIKEYYNTHKDRINERRRAKYTGPRKAHKVCYACDTCTSVRHNGKQDWYYNCLADGTMLYLCRRCYRGIVQREALNTLAKQYRKANLQHCREIYHKTYYKNREQILARQRLRRQTPAYKEYLVQHKEDNRLYKQRWQLVNKDRLRECRRIYAQEHRVQITARQKRWADERKRIDPNYRKTKQGLWYRKRKAADPSYGTKAWRLSRHK